MCFFSVLVLMLVKMLVFFERFILVLSEFVFSGFLWNIGMKNVVMWVGINVLMSMFLF